MRDTRKTRAQIHAQIADNFRVGLASGATAIVDTLVSLKLPYTVEALVSNDAQALQKLLELVSYKIAAGDPELNQWAKQTANAIADEYIGPAALEAEENGELVR